MGTKGSTPPTGLSPADTNIAATETPAGDTSSTAAPTAADNDPANASGSGTTIVGDEGRSTSGQDLTDTTNGAGALGDQAHGDDRRVEELQAEVDRLKSELETEVAEHDKTKAKLTKASKAGSVSAGARSEKPRKVGPMASSAAPIDPAELFRRLKEEDGPFTILLSDGQHEIRSLDPVRVAGDVWQQTPAGIVLSEPVTVSPDERISIAGFGLFDADMKQIAWTQLSMPVPANPGQQVKLDRQIVF